MRTEVIVAPGELATKRRWVMTRKVTMVLGMFNILCPAGAPGSGRCQERRIRVIPAEDVEPQIVQELEYKKNL